MQRYDIASIFFSYEEYRQLPPEQQVGKVRPSLCLINDTQSKLVMITSSDEKRRASDYEIVNWREAGLDKPSIIRFHNKVDLKSVGEFKIIGHLTDLDIHNIEQEFLSADESFGQSNISDFIFEKLVQPQKKESKQDYINRFMSDDLSKEEFPDNKQRYAVCMSYWENRKKNEDNEDLIVLHSALSGKEFDDAMDKLDGNDNLMLNLSYLQTHNPDGSLTTYNDRHNPPPKDGKWELSKREDFDGFTKITQQQRKILNRICNKYNGWRLAKEIAPLWDELEKAGADVGLILGYPDNISKDGSESWSKDFTFNGQQVENSRFIYSVYKGDSSTPKNEYLIYFS